MTSRKIEQAIKELEKHGLLITASLLKEILIRSKAREIK